MRELEQTVYGDLLFFVNFCMDFQCLFLTAKLLRRPFLIGRSALFSAVGALYACVALFLPLRAGAALLLDLAVCALMCVGCFAEKKNSFLRLFTPFAVYFFVSAAVGGVMSAMASLVSRLDLPGVRSGTSMSSFVFFLLAALGGLLTYAWGRFCSRRARGTRAMLTLTLHGKTLTVRGLFDTANLLCDPVSGRPVAVLEQRTASDWMPAAFPVEAVSATTLLAALPEELTPCARLIPIQTVTGRGLLLALLPDKALIDTGEGPREAQLLVSAAPLSGAPSDCLALLPAALLG